MDPDPNLDPAAAPDHGIQNPSISGDSKEGPAGELPRTFAERVGCKFGPEGECGFEPRGSGFQCVDHGACKRYLHPGDEGFDVVRDHHLEMRRDERLEEIEERASREEPGHAGPPMAESIGGVDFRDRFAVLEARYRSHGSAGLEEGEFDEMIEIAPKIAEEEARAHFVELMKGIRAEFGLAPFEPQEAEVLAKQSMKGIDEDSLSRLFVEEVASQLRGQMIEAGMVPKPVPALPPEKEELLGGANEVRWALDGIEPASTPQRGPARLSDTLPGTLVESNRWLERYRAENDRLREELEERSDAIILRTWWKPDLEAFTRDIENWKGPGMDKIRSYIRSMAATAYRHVEKRLEVEERLAKATGLLREMVPDGVGGNPDTWTRVTTGVARHSADEPHWGDRREAFLAELAPDTPERPADFETDEERP